MDSMDWHSAVVSCFCSLTLSTSFVAPIREVALGGVGVGPVTEVEALVRRTLLYPTASTRQTIFAQTLSQNLPATPRAQAVVAQNRGVLADLADWVLRDGRDVTIDDTLAKRLHLISDGGHFRGKQLVSEKPEPFERRGFIVSHQRGGTDIIIARKTMTELWAYLTSEEGLLLDAIYVKREDNDQLTERELSVFEAQPGFDAQIKFWKEALKKMQ